MSINRATDKEDVVYIHNVVLLNTTQPSKKNEIMSFVATCMDTETAYSVN